MKSDIEEQILYAAESSLMRGTWIEIRTSNPVKTVSLSSLMRGTWIEIRTSNPVKTVSLSSLMRGTWIEMQEIVSAETLERVVPHARDVD